MNTLKIIKSAYKKQIENKAQILNRIKYKKK